MLTHTFLHIPGIGQTTERMLWEAKVHRWDEAIVALSAERIPPRIRKALADGLSLSLEARRQRDVVFFADNLRPSDMWRLWAEFRHHACFLDIETTDLPPRGRITVASVADWEQIKVFITGENLWDLPKVLEQYQLVVTFNGCRFDIPMIAKRFPKWRRPCNHFDLLFPLKKLGYTGGLKPIMRRLRLPIQPPLHLLDGWLAPYLWREYKRGNGSALETLLAYNVSDVVHLPRLADFAYNMMVRSLAFRLPLFKYSPPLPNPYRADEALIRRLRNRFWWIPLP